MTTRHRIRVRGIVQGVGFRPFVYRLATSLELSGFVRNEPEGVLIEVEGDEGDLATFEHRLRADGPPLAAIESLDSRAIPAAGAAAFAIEESAPAAALTTQVPPDIALCDACRAEMLDPTNRRFRHPFINCTDCGPRFTVITGLPYDRPATTLAHFPLCPECAAEYRDPRSRRFHAEPIACPACGPRLGFCATGERGPNLFGEAALAAGSSVLAAGGILAIKGVGGFHLACDATSAAAVARLRERKGRGQKPFALMMRDLEVVRRYARVRPEEEELLLGRERPIVLLARHPDAAFPLAQGVAPKQLTLGVMLPYAPLHELLLGEKPLVMTSGNRSEEPIAREDDEALERLGDLADAFLVHDRPIHAACDDSVVRHALGGILPLRRSRGFAPAPLPLPAPAPPLLAVGGELKSVFALTEGRHAFLSQHLGDLENLETTQAFERALASLSELLRIRPHAVACDLHPGYFSTRWAREWAAREGAPLIPVQHHHAHVAALMAEHGLAGESPVLGVAFDGTGYGTDGTIWGGELLLADYRGFERLGHLAPVWLPGGDAAVRKPARMALAHLAAAGLPWDEALPPVAATTETERRLLARQLETGFASVATTSAGRLFDAVAALLGICLEATYEGQPAIELEAAAEGFADDGAWCFEVREGPPWLADPASVLAGMSQGLGAGVPLGLLSARFHGAVARLIVKLCERARASSGVATVGLTGGVFQNVRLLSAAVEGLEAAGFMVLVHRRVPPNDGGLALGQAAVAAYGGGLGSKDGSASGGARRSLRRVEP
ncbi:MAG TPA: carbamoyltransferase HypF [Thermoanaerobaculia bacterium]|nr:carbamoyltransferase HypF [Thermoanaerobaculia bacterium]